MYVYNKNKWFIFTSTIVHFSVFHVIYHECTVVTAQVISFCLLKVPVISLRALKGSGPWGQVFHNRVKFRRLELFKITLKEREIKINAIAELLTIINSTSLVPLYVHRYDKKAADQWNCGTQWRLLLQNWQTHAVTTIHYTKNYWYTRDIFNDFI